MIKKYGEDEGKLRYYEWYNKIFDKISKFIDRQAYSKVSQELFKQIDSKLSLKENESYYHNKNGEYVLVLKNSKKYRLDYYIPKYKIAVEFDGDVWHAHPKKYKPADMPIRSQRITVKEIWDRDKKRQKEIEMEGIKVIRIWERDYLNKKFNIDNFIKSFGILPILDQTKTL